MYVCVCINVEVRGHLSGISSFLLHVGPRNPSQVPRIGVRQFYSVSHLTTQEDVLIGSNKLLNTSLVIQHDHSW